MPVSGGMGQFSGVVIWREQGCLPPCRTPASKAYEPQLATSNLWLPNQLSSLRGWLRGQSVSINPVTSWHDDFGGTDAASLADPDLIALGLDGKNTVQFTAANTDLMTWLNVSAFTQGSVFFVAKAATNTQMGMPIGRTGTGGAFEQYNYAGTGGAIGSGFLSNAAHSTGAGVLGDVSQWHVLSIHSKAGEWTIRYNGTEVYTTATNTVAGSASASLLGRDEVASAYFNGQLAEMFITNDALTTADRERAEGYLAHQWNLASVLPGGHTYASAPPNLPDAITGSTALTFAPSATLTGTGALSGSASLTLTPAGTVLGRGAVTGSSLLVLSPSGTLTGKGTLTGSTTLVLSPSGTISGKGTLTGASALTFAPAGTLGGLGALSGSLSLSLSPTGLLSGIGSLSGTASLAFSLDGVLTALIDISGSTNLAFSAAGNVTGIARLSGSADFAFILSGSLTTGPWVLAPRPILVSIAPPTIPSAAALALTSDPLAVGIISPAPPPLVDLGD